MKRLHEADIDLNLLRVLVVVLQERSMTRAAERLRITQPAVSFAIRRLREILGDPLFVKSGNSLVPTQYALSLEAPLSDALSAIWHSVAPGVLEPSTMQRHFRIAMSSVGEFALLPFLLRRVRAEAPKVTIETCRIPVEAVDDALRIGRVDLAVGNYRELGPATRRVLLMRDKYVCLVWAGSAAAQKTLEVADFIELSHILVATVASSHRAIETMFAEHGIHRNVVLTVSGFEAVPDLVRGTDLAVVLPSKVADRLNRGNEFRGLPLPVPVQDFEVTLHWDARLDADSGNAWLRSLILSQRELCDVSRFAKSHAGRGPGF